MLSRCLMCPNIFDCNLVQSICFCTVVHVRVISPFHFVQLNSMSTVTVHVDVVYGVC